MPSPRTRPPPDGCREGRLRQATEADMAGIWRVRHAVHENRLSPGVISDEDVRRELHDTGRGWVVVDRARDEGDDSAAGPVLAFESAPVNAFAGAQ